MADIPPETWRDVFGHIAATPPTRPRDGRALQLMRVAEAYLAGRGVEGEPLRQTLSDANCRG